MIRKYLFIALVMSPLLSFAQNRTIIISGSDNHRSVFNEVFRHLLSPLKMVDRIFNNHRNFGSRLHDRITLHVDRHSGLTYQLPVITGDERRIILNNRNVIILPQRKFQMNDDRNEIIIKKNGRTIHIYRDRRI